MAVYTEVPPADAQSLLTATGLGQLVSIEGSLGGIENTNYFLRSERDGITSDWVLTLFERLSAQQLPFYLGLMRHLAARGLPVPDPIADASGNTLLTVRGKPAALVNRLRGKSPRVPSVAQCHSLGATLARLHLAARDCPWQQPNLRGLAWWTQTAAEVRPFLSQPQLALLHGELAYQHHVASTGAHAAVPRGAIHGDLFRDNVLFEGDEVSGLFDFYFAGTDAWVFDLAICLNDWAVDPESAHPRSDAAFALLQGYGSVRVLTGPERQLMPAMLRAAALRFWLSRLRDLHLPRDAQLLQAHNPGHFETVLRQRISALTGLAIEIP